MFANDINNVGTLLDGLDRARVKTGDGHDLILLVAPREVEKRT